MTRSRTALPQLAAALAVALILSPARSQETGLKADDSKRMVELLDKIEKRLGNQQAQTEVLMDIVRKDLKDLRDEVARLQKEVTDLRRSPAGAGTSTSNYPQAMPTGPSTSNSMTQAAPLAHVRLVNTYFTDMTALINGVPYTVAPGQERIVTVSAGVLTYSVLQVPTPPQTRMLVPNETLTLTLTPR
jgi:hypothetical protein